MPAPANFQVETHTQGDTLFVVPHGEIDLATVGLVRDAVDRDWQPGASLVLDLRSVLFMDTSGLRYVLELHERSQQEGFDLRVVRGPVAVQRVFEVSGVEARLPFVDEAGPDSAAG